MIIEEYREKATGVLSYFREKGRLAEIKVAGEDHSLVQQDIKSYLAQNDILPVERVPMYFIDSTNSREVRRIGMMLSRKLGLKYWQAEELGGKGEELVERMGAKLEQYNHKGSYLISGFPKDKE